MEGCTKAELCFEVTHAHNDNANMLMLSECDVGSYEIRSNFFQIPCYFSELCVLRFKHILPSESVQSSHYTVLE